MTPALPRRSARLRSRRAGTAVAAGTAVLALICGPTETAAAAAPAASPSSAAAPTSPAEARAARLLTSRAAALGWGTGLAGAVRNTAAGADGWGRYADRGMMPASTAKIATAVTALQVYGPQHRFRTVVRKGRTWSRVALVGSGDPNFTGPQLTALARTTAAAVKTHGVRSVDVIVDDRLFPAPTAARGWLSGYMPGEVSPVRALVVSEHRRWDTSVDAGRVFAARLKAYGIATRSVTRGAASSAAPVLAAQLGPSLGWTVKEMLLRSDNDHAEGLYRLVAVKTGRPATWAGAEAAQRAVLRRLGVDLGTSHVYDGSGLSRADRISPRQLTGILDVAADPAHPRLAGFRSSLPVAGRTGTLAPAYKRFTTAPSSCAAGDVQAKTGSLRSVITLAGYAPAADGALEAFAFMSYGQPATLLTRQRIDRLAATVTGCW